MLWLIYALLTAVLVSFSTLMEKKVLFKEHAMEFSAVLALFNMILALPFFLFVDFSKITLRPLVYMFLASIMAAVAFLLIIKAMRHMEVSSVSPLVIMGPGLTAVLAFIFLGESLSVFEILGIGLLLFGAYILETKDRKHLLEPFKIIKESKYIHFILISILLYSITSLISRVVLAHYNLTPETYIAIIHIFLAINFFIMLAFFHDGIKGIKHGMKNAWLPILIVSVFVISYRFFQANAIKLARVGLVESVKKLSVLFTVIIGGEIFHEKNLMKKIIASLIMTAGVLLIVI
ncbi:EamA family transporter [Candidatus Woesearchaeota archaeon]|nr:EamA family transporter [Candidatus Woesearchaeota archaeon]